MRIRARVLASRLLLHMEMHSEAVRSLGVEAVRKESPPEPRKEAAVSPARLREPCLSPSGGSSAKT